MIDIGIITAPRELPTLKTSVNSLRQSGVSRHIHIFSEPGSIEVEGRNMTLHISVEKKGAFANYDFALRYLIENGKGNKVLILEDDYIYAKDTGYMISRIDNLEDRFGYYNLFTNGHHPRAKDLFPKRGWNEVREVGRHAWGVAYIMRKDVARVMRGDEFYQKILREKNQMIDGAVSEALKRLELPMYYHNPSLCYSIPAPSTLNHSFPTDGLNFKSI